MLLQSCFILLNMFSMSVMYLLILIWNWSSILIKLLLWKFFINLSDTRAVVMKGDTSQQYKAPKMARVVIHHDEGKVIPIILQFHKSASLYQTIYSINHASAWVCCTSLFFFHIDSPEQHQMWWSRSSSMSLCAAERNLSRVARVSHGGF